MLAGNLLALTALAYFSALYPAEGVNRDALSLPEILEGDVFDALHVNQVYVALVLIDPFDQVGDLVIYGYLLHAHWMPYVFVTVKRKNCKISIDCDFCLCKAGTSQGSDTMQYRDPQDCTYEELEEAIKHGRQDVKYLDGEQFKLDLMKMVAGQLYPGADKLPDDLAELLCAFTDEYIFVYLETYRQ